MKVILLRDVAKLGKRFSIVEVPDGFALNKLIPQGFAQAASAENLKKVNARTEKQESTKSNGLTEFKNTLVSLKDVTVKIAVDANAQNHLFKSVKTSDLAAALLSAGHPLPVSSLQLAEPIKALGTYAINVLMGEVSGIVNFELVSK